MCVYYVPYAFLSHGDGKVWYNLKLEFPLPSLEFVHFHVWCLP
jgi:hypothetical protein